MRHIFLDFHSLPKPISVSLPNGIVITVEFVGSIQLNSHLILQNVLYIPTFSYNFIFVSVLTNQSSLIVTFTTCSCSIQDPMLGKQIGIGRRCGNLYVLSTNNVFTVSCNTVVLNSTQLWHSRLGHASFDRIVDLKSVLPNITKNVFDSHCDVCHLAKQHRLPFDSNVTFASEPFALIHIDI